MRQTSRGPARQEHSPLAGDVFRFFPNGILVLDRSGSVVAANAQASNLLAGPGSDLRGLSCCELLGCGGDGPLADLCLTEVALEYAERLPEMRLDLPSGASAVWVTAARLGSQPQIILEVRRGDPNDRRRRTEPHWSGATELRISALGRTRVESKEGPIGGAWLEQRPGRLLKLLVCERPRVVPSASIAAALWPGAGSRSIGSLRQCVYELRDRLEPGRPRGVPSTFVISRQGGYALARSHVRLDVDDFERYVETGLRAFYSGDRAVAVRELRLGLELYEGDLFADDPYIEWAMAERDRLRDQLARALSVLGELALQDGKLSVAALHFRRLAELEPFDVPIQRRLIEVCLREGRRSEAHRRFTALRERMLREFGEPLDFDIAELARPQSDQLSLG